MGNTGQQIKFTVTPAELCRQSNLGRFKQNRNWLTFAVCPACGGGANRDANTFIVHAIDGNFVCTRAKCGVSGSFWQLFERVGLNPKDFIDRDLSAKPSKSRPTAKKKFVYQPGR